MRILRWRRARPTSPTDEYGALPLPLPLPSTSTPLISGVQSDVSVRNSGVHVSVRVEIDATPEEVWDVLRSPESSRIFRNIKVVHYRNIIEDDGMGNRKLKVAHRAVAKLLLLTLAFDTKLWVWENKRARSMRYAVCEPTMLKTYEGRWSLTALPPAGGAMMRQLPPSRQQRSLDSQRQLPASHQQSSQDNQLRTAGLGNWSNQCWHQLSGANSRSRTLLALEQTMVPVVPLPGPVQRCLGELCSRQISSCVADLDAELQRRKGAPKDANETALALQAAWRDATSLASVSLHNFMTTFSLLA